MHVWVLKCWVSEWFTGNVRGGKDGCMASFSANSFIFIQVYTSAFWCLCTHYIFGVCACSLFPVFHWGKMSQNSASCFHFKCTFAKQDTAGSNCHKFLFLPRPFPLGFQLSWSSRAAGSWNIRQGISASEIPQLHLSTHQLYPSVFCTLACARGSCSGWRCPKKTPENSKKQNRPPIEGGLSFLNCKASKPKRGWKRSDCKLLQIWDVSKDQKCALGNWEDSFTPLDHKILRWSYQKQRLSGLKWLNGTGNQRRKRA